VDYCIAAARLGLDPYSEAEPYESAIMRAADRFSGRSVLNDFFDAVEPEHIDAALDWLDVANSIIRRSGGAAQKNAVREMRRELRQQLGPQTFFPWEIGWYQAKQVRRLIEVGLSEPLDLGAYISDAQRKLDDMGLLAAGASADEPNPVVVMGRSRAQTARRFTLARALWHYLWGEENALFVVTTAYTDRQKVERAFAAELLAPAEGIAQLLETEPNTASLEELEQVAQRFNVSPMIIHHQLQNQLLSA
jgi:Zn-dependent peptidase ImmA (M78 family)